MYSSFLYVDKSYMHACVIHKILLLYLRDMKSNIIARFLALWDVSRLGSCCVPPAIPDHCFCSIPRSHQDMDDVFSDIWHFCRSFLNGILFLLSLSLMLFEQFFLKSLTGSSAIPLCSFCWASHPPFRGAGVMAMRHKEQKRLPLPLVTSLFLVINSLTPV